MPWRRPFLLHAQTGEHSARVRRAQKIVAEALIMPRQGYVALSGGKDSTVVLSLVREQAPETPAVFSDDEWWLPETEEYLRGVEGLHWIRTNATHAAWFKTDGDYDGIPDYAARQGWSMVFLGLRAEESAQRRAYLCKYGTAHINKAGAALINPIAWWTTQDVWAYILSHGLLYNRAYDRLRGLGLEPCRQRIGPFATERALGYGQLAILKRGWPELYNRFAAAHPEVTAYV